MAIAPPPSARKEAETKGRVRGGDSPWLGGRAAQGGRSGRPKDARVRRARPEAETKGGGAGVAIGPPAQQQQEQPDDDDGDITTTTIFQLGG